MEHAIRLTGVDLEGQGRNDRITLNGLHRRLNLVLAGPPTTRQRLRGFLEKGIAAAGMPGLSASTDPECGVLQFQRGGRIGTVEISRDGLRVADCFPAPGTDAGPGRMAGPDPLMTSAQRECFASLLNVDCDPDAAGNSAAAMRAATRNYVRNFVGETGADFWRSEADYLRWTEESRMRKGRLEALFSSLRQLESGRQTLKSRIAELKAMAGARSLAEQELAATHHSVQHLQGTLSRLDQERDRLDREIVMLENSLQSPAAPAPRTDGRQVIRMAGLLERIDEIDLQTGQLESLQSRIQDERLRLKNEASEAAALSPESAEHPYHQVGEIVGHIDAIVGQTDAAAHQTTSPKGESRTRRELRFADQPSAREFAAEVVKNGARIQSGLKSLCGELESQYRHVRHRATVAELRQLRRCFDDLDGGLLRLAERRRTLILELAELDPELARAASQGDPEVLRSLRDGAVLASFPANSGSCAPPPGFSGNTALRDRLAELNSRRQTVALELAQVREQLQAARIRLQHQSSQLDRNRDADLSGLEKQESELAARIAATRTEIDPLQLQVDEDMKRPVWVASPALGAASALLSQLSGGQFLRFEIHCESGEPGSAGTVSGSPGAGLQVVDSQSRTWHAGTLSSEARRDCRLALAFAAQRQMAGSSQAVPMLIEISGPQLPDAWMNRLTELLEQQGQADHQLVALCDRTPVLSSGSGLDRHEWFQIFDLRKQPLHESTARIVRWTSLPTAPDVRPLVYHDAADWRPAVHQSAPRFASALPAAPHLSGGDLSHPAIETVITEESLLRHVGLCPGRLGELLESGRVYTVGDLLDLDPFDLPEELEHSDLAADELDRIQAMAWLTVCAPGMTPLESRLLVQCGILEPEQLESIPAGNLFMRVKRHLAASPGSKDAGPLPDFSQDRLRQWMRALESTRSQWHRPSGYSRSQRRQTERPAGLRTWPADCQTGYFARPRDRQYQPGDAWFEDQARTRPSIWRSPDQESEPNAANRPRPESSTVTGAVLRADSTGTREERPAWDRESRRDLAPERAAENGVRGSENGVRSSFHEQNPLNAPRHAPAFRNAPGQPAAGLKFHLNPDDPVEAAPSIGPKTAARFEAIGIGTIRDFLRTTAESMADRINFKRFTADVIRQWQEQSRLVCRIPNLRDHDAQLLVACGIREAEQLERLSPRQLLDLVGPFSDTKEGMKIIRSGKKPDLAEVTDWIQWAKHTRSLHAA